jgi:hypothetical protein
MKRAILKLSYKALLTMLRGEQWAAENLPDDARIIDVSVNAWGLPAGEVQILVESEAYPETALDNPLPVYEPKEVRL